MSGYVFRTWISISSHLTPADPSTFINTRNGASWVQRGEKRQRNNVRRSNWMQRWNRLRRVYLRSRHITGAMTSTLLIETLKHFHLNFHPAPSSLRVLTLWRSPPSPSTNMSFKTLFNSPFNPLFLLQLCTLFTSFCTAAGRDDWRRRSVYQLMTDRFARTNDNDNSPCDVLKYCGGTYKGLINHLDWIQDMGFTAVSLLCPREFGDQG